MRENRLCNRITAILCAFFASLISFEGQAQEVYANLVTDSSTDFRNAHRVADANRTNYAAVSQNVSILSSSHIRVRFPVSGKAGDAVNFTIQGGDGQLLSLGLLSNARVRLYDSLGVQVATSATNNDLELALLTDDSIYNIRYVTNPAGGFKFKEARIEFNNLLTVNLLSEFRIYGAYYQIPCPLTLANSVKAFGTNGLLTGFVSDPNNAVDANTNNYATLTTPLNLLNLLPPAYLELNFPTPARPGEFVGFTVGQASTLLSANLLSSLEITLYDQNGVARATKNNFNTLDLRLLEGTVDRYVLGFTLPQSNYRMHSMRIQLNSVLSLLQNLRVYNAFHYQIDRPPVPVTFSRSPILCQGETVTLTAATTPHAMSYMWSNGAQTKSITVSQAGIYSVTVMDSFDCSRRSLDIEVKVNALPKPVIVGDTVSCENTIGTLRTSLPYVSYMWSTGSSAATIEINKGGLYSVTVKDANGCSNSDNVTVATNKLSITPTITNTNCSNNNTGAISLAVSGGSNSYSYRWSTGATTSTVNNIGAGLYTVNVRDNQQGCSYNKSFTISANNTLSVKSAIVNTTSCGASDGKVAITVIGGSGNYTYAWSNGATTANLNNVKAGMYKATITDATSGCATTYTVVVNDGGSTLNVNGTVNPATSCNAANGSITLSVTGGTGPNTYLWENNATTANRTGLAAGTYYVTVTNTATGCVAAKAFEVGNSAQLTVNGNVTATGCGRSTGAITATVSGGSGNYTYSWSDGVTTANRTSLAPGAYILNVTDNTSGCKGTRVFVVGTATPPAVTLNVVQPACGTNNNGSITITTTGNYQYLWSNNSTTKDQASLRPGTYTVTVTDPTTFCSANYQATLVPRSQIQLVAAPTSNTSCATSANGAIDVTVTGGTPPYTYQWSSGQATQDISMLNSGIYTLNTNDANGCSASITVPVSNDTTKTIGVYVDSVKLASCNNAANGSLIVSARGGVAPYTYKWSNGANTKDLVNVLPGNYSVTVTDFVGCTVVLNTSLGIDSAKAVKLTIDSATAAKCSGSNTGSIYVTTSGGKSPYAYLWNTGAKTEDLFNVASGSYTLTVTDDQGCTAQASANVDVDTANRIIATATTITPAKCEGSETGGVDVTVTGGTAPYTYSWSNGAKSQDLSSVKAGNYTLTINDAAGCTSQLGVNIGVDSANAVTAMLDSVINVGCVDPNSGSIFVSVKGGTTPYTYMWNDGNTAEDRARIPGGDYKLTVTDFIGCKDELDVKVSNAALLVVDEKVNSATCYGANDGSIMLTIAGGKQLTFTWSNGATGNEIRNLAPGMYTVNIYDNVYMCSLSDTFNVTQPDSLKAIAQVIKDDCFDNPTGEVMLEVSGGTSPYKYVWSTGSTAEDIEALQAGRYDVTITDNNNCTLTTGYDVTKDNCSFDIIVRTVLTPNGDGVNDAWIIEGILFYPGNTVYVYNKWGDLVYNTKNYDNTWMGTNNKGEQLGDGTYYYVLKLNQENKAGGKTDFSGFFMIQR